MKKALSLFLALVMVVSLAVTVGITASAETELTTRTFTLNVPQIKNCTYCDGGMVECLDCYGMGGEYQMIEPTLELGWVECSTCHGEGFVLCSHCVAGKIISNTEISVIATGKLEVGETLTMVNSTASLPVNFTIKVGTSEHSGNAYTFQKADEGCAVDIYCEAVSDSYGTSGVHLLGNVASMTSGFEYYAAGSQTPAVCKTWDELSGMISSGSTVKLVGNVKLSSGITVADGQDYTLDLNGSELDLNKNNIIVSGKLTIIDSSEAQTGIIKNGSSAVSGDVAGIGGTFVIINNINPASLVIKGGTIRSGTAVSGGAVAAMEGTTFEMLGGKIIYCHATNGGAIFNYKSNVTISDAVITYCDALNYGGAIFNSEGTVTLNSGAILDSDYVMFGTDIMGGGVFNKGTLVMNSGAIIRKCSSAKGGAVHNDGNSWVTFTMNGGTITNCTGTSNGGAVQNSANATFNMNGGTITGNRANSSLGGGVFNKGTMNLSGDAVIADNLNGNIATANKINVSAFTGSAGICFIKKVSDAYTMLAGNVANDGSAEFIDRFFSDSSECILVANETNALSLNSNSSAILDLRTYLSDEDEAVVNIASAALNEITATANISTYAAEIIYSGAIQSIAVVRAQSSAISEINSEAISSTAAMNEIVSTAITDIKAARTVEDVETIRSNAIAAIRDQLVIEAAQTSDSTVWFAVVAAVAMLGCAVVSKKYFF